ncbi:MAG: type III secretion protein HrpF [Acidiferrobacterales bacterium]|nr:type III secretion protein HrpF [Acidiferrobacterales bacterium]
MAATNFQKHLDNQYSERSDDWSEQLKDINWGGDFELADAEAFFRATTAKNVGTWAVGLELKTRHNALKKIIDSA